MTNIDLESYFVRSDRFEDLKMLSQSQSLFHHSSGHFFGPFRERYGIHVPKGMRSAIILRDPRDVLTSYYYSVLASHSIIHPRILSMREEAKTMTVDEYVLQTSNRFYAIFADYCEMLESDENMVLLKYEDMVADFEGWMRELVSAIGLDTNEALIEQLIIDASFDTIENINSHKRQVTPGDHKRKLQKSTVDKLNTIFADILTKLDYA